MLRVSCATGIVCYRHHVLQASCAVGLVCYRYHVLWASCATGIMCCGPRVLQVSCAAGIMCYRYHVLQASCAAGIMCYRHRVLQVSCAVGVMCCGRHVLRASCAAGIMCCGHHVLRASCATGIMCYRRHVLRASCAVGVMCCGHHVLRASCAVGVMCCGRHVLRASWVSSELFLFCVYLVLSDNQEMKKAIEEELTSPPNEVAFFSDAPSNLETKRTRQKYLERRISALSDGDDPRPQLPLSDHTPMSPDKKRVLFRQISKQQSMIESTKETAMKKDEKTALIGEEQAETGNVSLCYKIMCATHSTVICQLLTTCVVLVYTYMCDFITAVTAYCNYVFAIHRLSFLCSWIMPELRHGSWLCWSLYSTLVLKDCQWVLVSGWLLGVHRRTMILWQLRIKCT